MPAVPCGGEASSQPLRADPGGPALGRLDRPAGVGRAQAVLRQSRLRAADLHRAPAGRRRRDLAVEHRPGGGPDQPPEDDQAPDVRSCQLRPPQPPVHTRGLITKTGQEPQMAPLVHLEVAGDWGGPIGFGRDHGNRAPVVQLGAEPVAVEGFVRQQGSEVEIRQKRGDPHAVVSGSRTNRTRLPSASTSATIVKPPRERPMACVLVPPFALVPCWCTRTMVPSTMTYSKSVSSDKASKI